MQVEIDGAAKALRDDDRSTARAGDAGAPSTALVPVELGAHEDAADGSAQRGVEGEREADLKRKRRTPFLSVVHALSANPLLRRLSSKLDALEAMYVHERRTYDQWLGRPGEIVALLERYFEPQRLARRFGKLEFVGIARSAGR